MSGREKSLYFWVLQRHTLNSQPELRKIAGEYEARVFRSIMVCHVLQSPFAQMQSASLVSDVHTISCDMLV